MIANLSWIWFLIIPPASVICTLALARLIKSFFSPFYGSIFIDPSDQKATFGERTASVIRMWLVYFVTILVFTLTSGSFSYGVIVIRIASSSFNLEDAKQLINNNNLAIQQTLFAGLFIGIVVVVIARLMTVSYSDFLLRYLIFQLLVPLNVILISIPIILSGPGPQFYEAMSDYLLRGVIPNLPILILITATLAALATEVVIILMNRYWPSSGKGTYPLVDSILQNLIEGEYTISSSNVIELYTSAITATLNGVEADRLAYPMRWLSYSGNKEIARCIRTEVRANIAFSSYSIPHENVRDYDNRIYKWADQLDNLYAGNKKINPNFTPLIEKINRHVHLPDGVTSPQMLLDDLLENRAQEIIKQNVKIITRKPVAQQLEQILDAEYAIDDHVGSRRFMILGGEKIILTCPVGKAIEDSINYGSNVGILISDAPYIVHHHKDFFDNRWDNLSHPDDQIVSMRAILIKNLNLKKEEKLLILVDNLRPWLIRAAHKFAEQARLAINPKSVHVFSFSSTGSNAAEPPLEVWETAFGRNAIKELQRRGYFNRIIDNTYHLSQEDKENIYSILSKFQEEKFDVVISLAWFSLSHTKFRYIFCHSCHGRLASMPKLSPNVLCRCGESDYTVIEPRTRKIAELLTQATTAYLEAPNGTKMTFSLESRVATAATGLIDQPGFFGNIPGGEAYIAPIEDQTNGTLVFEYAPNRHLSNPIRLSIKNGNAERVTGDNKYRNFLRSKFKEQLNNHTIAELGIGTNDKASDPTQIRESEKILGTVHVALGDNSNFGGTSTTPFHEDFVVFAPTLILHLQDNSDIYLLREGILNPEYN